MRVLIADDEPVAQRVLKAIVQSIGAEAVVVGDGAEALRHLEEDALIEVAILDWMMPKLSGIEVCKRVRSLKTSPHRYILILTAKTREQDMIEAFGAGADEVLTKPISAESLKMKLGVASRIQGLISASRSKRSMRSALAEAETAGHGELVIRCTNTVGRVYFHGGRVAWVQIEGQPFDPAVVVGSTSARTDEEIGVVLAECRRTGRAFDDVMVEIGLVTREQIDQALARWMSEQLGEMLKHPDCETMFLPGALAIGGRRTFSLAELLGGDETAPAQNAPQPKARVRALSGPTAACLVPHGKCQGCEGDSAPTLSPMLDQPGMKSAALVSTSTAGVLGQVGAPMDTDLIQTGMRFVRAAQNLDPVEVVSLTSGSTHTVIYRTPCPEAFLLAVADRDVQLGLVRVAAESAAKAIVPDPEELAQ